MKAAPVAFPAPPRPCAGAGRPVGCRPESTRARDPDAGRFSRAFSLVEILIVTGLLSVIVLGLMAMFGQTQRAFRAGLTQTDVLEAGRAATDLIARDLEQLRPADLRNAVNFYAEIPGPPYTPLLQELPGTDRQRTNVLQDLFFLTCENRRWSAVGYRVSTPLGGVGTLYRYLYGLASAVDAPAYLPALWSDFLNTPITDTNRFSRVADGVVHLRVRAFDTNGVWITDEWRSGLGTNRAAIHWSSIVPGEIGLYLFRSNAVPAAVEIELGFLESRALERARGLPDATVRREFMQRQAGQVHLFRQRVPIRSVDPEAYR